MDHNLQIGVQKNYCSENGGKTLMQVSDHHLTTQICIFILLSNLKNSFSFAVGNPLSNGSSVKCHFKLSKAGQM